MFTMRNLNHISVQSWTYLFLRGSVDGALVEGAGEGLVNSG